VFIGLALALSATQSRESMIGFVVGAAVIVLLRRNGWPVIRVVSIALVLVIGFAAAQVAFSPSNRAELQRRFNGVLSAIHLGSGSEQSGYCVEGNKGCDASNPNRVPQREIRVLYYQQGAKLWLKRPVFGYGVGQFGGIVATEHDPRWYADPRFGPGGFKTYGFNSQQVDSFWLHLVVETGAAGTLAYLVWLALLIAPFVTLAYRRRRSEGTVQRAPPLHPFAYWAPAAVAFGAVIAFFSSSLEDPLFPALLFTVLGVAWVLLRRGELTSPEAPTTASDHRAPAGALAGTQSMPAGPQTGPTGLSRARNEP
jgi:O-antigen ligase